MDGEDRVQRNSWGGQIKWEPNGARLVLPLRSDGGEPSVECIKFSYEHQCTA